MKKLLFILLVIVGAIVMSPRDGFAPLVLHVNEDADTTSTDSDTVDLSDVDDNATVQLLR